MSGNNLSPLQKKLLEMLKWFHSFCENNGLRYYAIGGTLLGAIRHKGFIPWDDDIDLGMPRRDYERLAELMAKHDHPIYELETPESKAEEFVYVLSKIYDKTTTLVENKRKRVVRGVFIDIFPLDGFGDTREACEATHKRIQRLYNFFLVKTCTVRKGRSFYKNLAVIATGLIPSSFINDKKIALRLNEICKELDFDKSKWVGNVLGVYGLREAVKREIFGRPSECKFEDAIICIVEKPDEYLTSIYGDWRKLPPPEKQVSHHEFAFLDMETPYKTYER